MAGQQSKAGGNSTKGRFTNRGRVLASHEREEFQAIMAQESRPLVADRLIEYLHIIQDKLGYLPLGLMQALGEELKQPMVAIYEVASFYHHFTILADGETPPPKTIVRVCESLSCALAGGKNLHKSLSKALDGQARVELAPCMGECDHAPAVMVGRNPIAPANADKVVEAFVKGAWHTPSAHWPSLADYRAEGGMACFEKLRSGSLTKETIIEELHKAGLRGLGGAGFPTGRKWDLVRKAPAPRLMAVNGDEGEPGTFKDRLYLETKPWQILEGILIASWVVEAKEVYIYIRDEYPLGLKILAEAMQELDALGMTSHTKLHLRRGAGAYICGEESAMIESIEGKRGLPRHRPPYVAEKGLFDRPTLVNNLETMLWVPFIVQHGGAEFAAKGMNGGAGWRSYSVSGRVAEPGVKLAPAGISLNQLIQDYCGGMAKGHELKAFLPGGASGGILPVREADRPLDFGKLEELGSFVGSHAVVVLSDKDDLKAVAENLMEFFSLESCGQCTPCRVGTRTVFKLLRQGDWNVEKLEALSQWMTDSSICGLGQAAANPIKSILRHFPEVLP